MSPSTTASWRSSSLTHSRSRRSPNRFSSSPSRRTSAGPDRGEGRVGLGLEELGLRKLDVAGRDVVGHDQAGDERRPVLLGDLGAHGQLAADDQADLDLVVQEPHVIRPDDVVERAADRARRLAEEGQGDGVRVETRVLDVAGEVGHLRHHPTGGRHRGHQVEGGRVDGLLARPSGLDLLGRGEQLTGGRGVGVDPRGAAGGADPPGVGGTKDGDAHELVTFRRPRRRVRSNSLSSRSERAIDTSSCNASRVPG